MTPPRILVAGIGNIFLGDDAFGVEVAARLKERKLPDSVSVVDFGIRGFDLACALLDGCDVAILVDAAPRGEPPGTLFLIEPELPAPAEAGSASAAGGEALALGGHGLDPVQALRLAAVMGGTPARVLLVGCEPAPLPAGEDAPVGLSEAARAAVHGAVGLIEGLIGEVLANERNAAADGP